MACGELEARLVTIHTSALIAAIDQRDPNYVRATVLFRAKSRPLIIPAGILAEICYFLETRYGPRLLEQFLENVESRAFLLNFPDADVQRVTELVRRYRDMPLGYADAAVIACAERNGGRIAIFDLRHFGAVAREGAIEIVP